MKLTIPVVTRTQDNGDGGWTTYAYNNNEELLADHPMTEDGKVVNGKWIAETRELTEEEKDSILNEDDPYENGYIGHDTIVIDVDEKTGIARLALPISFHAGQ